MDYCLAYTSSVYSFWMVALIRSNLEMYLTFEKINGHLFNKIYSALSRHEAKINYISNSRIITRTYVLRTSILLN